MEGNQFDTIYHEHFSYFSLLTTAPDLRRPTASRSSTSRSCRPTAARCGSTVRHAGARADGPACRAMLERRARRAGSAISTGTRASTARVGGQARLLAFLIEARRAGRTVAGYGAPGKGNTLLNYCGIRTDLLAYTVDRNPYKHGRFTPGTRIPILAHADRVAVAARTYVWILPWNLRDEIARQLAHAASGGLVRGADPERRSWMQIA